MLEGDRLLTAMAYNIMKMHRSKSNLIGSSIDLQSDWWLIDYFNRLFPSCLLLLVQKHLQVYSQINQTHFCMNVSVLVLKERHKVILEMAF